MDKEGLNLVGFLHAGLGQGITARLIQRSIELAGIPHAPVSYQKLESDKVVEGDPEKAGESALYNTNLICLNGDQLLPFAREMGADFFQNRRNIGVWWWETEHLPSWMQDGFAFLDELWLCSSFVQSAVEKVSPVPIRHLPHPVIMEEVSDLSVLEEHGFGERYVFLFCFDFLSDLRRKNPLGLIQAFEKAFPNPEEGGPLLVIKTINGEKRPLDFALLDMARGNREDIRLLDGYWPLEQKNALMARGDCYVSLHRSEGLGMTIMETMALGKPAIATGYSGNLEFMNEEDSFLVKHGFCKIEKASFPYPEGESWAEPDLEDAARLMAYAAAHPEEAAEKGKKAAERMAADFSLQRTAETIRELFEKDWTPRKKPSAEDILSPHSKANRFLKKPLEDKVKGFHPKGFFFRRLYPQIVDLLQRYDRTQNKTLSAALKSIKEKETTQNRNVQQLQSEIDKLRRLVAALVEAQNKKPPAS